MKGRAPFIWGAFFISANLSWQFPDPSVRTMLARAWKLEGEAKSENQ